MSNLLLYWYLQILSLNSIFISLLIGIQSTRFVRLWIFLELRTLSIIFFILRELTSHDSFQDTIKFFIIQALRGLSIFVMGISQEINRTNLFFFLFRGIILFKIGAAPFHIWLLSLVNGFSWPILFIFLTIIKFIPFQILSTLIPLNLSIFGTISFLIAGLLIFYCVTLKQLIVISSIVFIGTLFFILKNGIWWINLLLIYSINFLPFMYLLWLVGQQKRLLVHRINFGLIKVRLAFLFFRIRGIPPLPGFFIKLFWLIESQVGFFSILMFLIVSGASAYIYLRVWIRLINWRSNLVIQQKFYSYYFNELILIIIFLSLFVRLFILIYYYI